jgi:hypothetical protein
LRGRKEQAGNAKSRLVDPIDPLLFSEAFETGTVECRFGGGFDPLRQSRSIRLGRLR